MRPIILALTIYCITIAGSVFGETQQLSLNEAVDIARRENPGLLSAGYEVQAARAHARGAGSLANPTIEITPGITGSAATDEELLITQPLEINGQRRIRAGIADAETRASEAAYTSAERELIRSVTKTYWDVVQAQALVDLSRENTEISERLYQAVQRQLEVGTAPGMQVVKAEVEQTRARQELARAESELAQTKALLNTLLGRAPQTPFDPSDKLAYTPVAVNADDLRSEAEANRPELAESKAILSAREQEIRMARASRRPDLTLQARQETIGGEGGVAVGISIPIIDWGSARQEKRRATAAAEAQEKRLETAGNTVRLDVDSALRELHRAEGSVRSYQQGVISQAERLMDAADKGYRTGATGYLDVLEAQRTLRNVKAEYSTALADYMRALAQLEWAAGVDLTATDPKEAAK